MGEDDELAWPSDWQFVRDLLTEHVWDGFVLLSLLEDCAKRDERLNVPHDGEQRDRFTAAMLARNTRIQLYGQPDSRHYCNGCTRFYQGLPGQDGIGMLLSTTS